MTPEQQLQQKLDRMVRNKDLMRHIARDESRRRKIIRPDIALIPGLSMKSGTVLERDLTSWWGQAIVRSQ